MRQFKKNHFLFIITLLFLSCTSVHAQTTNTSADNTKDIVFTKVDVDAQFPGGIQAWVNYIGNNVDGNVPVKNGAPVGKYKVFVRFIVSKDGSIINIQPETNFGYGMEEEAMRVIKNAPNWTPAIQNKQNVNAYKRQPITFDVVADSTKTNNNPVKDSSTLLLRDSDIVFTKLEIDPQFPGGLNGWAKFLHTNLDAGVPINNGAPAGTYRVMIRFIVNKDGSLRDIQPETDFGYGLEKEALRVLKLSPNWIPGKQNGYVVNAYKRQPITFIVMNSR